MGSRGEPGTCLYMRAKWFGEVRGSVGTVFDAVWGCSKENRINQRAAFMDGLRKVTNSLSLHFRPLELQRKKMHFVTG